MTPFYFFLICLATWRLSSLAANEDGPFDLFKRFRIFCDFLCSENRVLEVSKINEGLKCEWCNSIWISSIIISIIQIDQHRIFTIETVIYIFAVSTGVIFIKYVIETLNRSQNETKQ
jgi:hypothetical protein